VVSPLRVLVGIDFSPESRAAVQAAPDLVTARRRKNESYRLLRGDPASGLRREAARGYDPLVMGTRGRGRATAFLLGSTVQEVLHRSAIPIVVVPARRGS